MANEQRSTAAGADSQALTFVLGSETYGIDILRVQEIRGWSAVTRLPHAPPHVLGVLNLRGSIVPVVDLRMRFALQEVAYLPVTVIIVVAVMSAAGRRDFGLVVDGVSDVVTVDVGRIKAAPEIGLQEATAFIRGLVPINDKMVVLLDIDRLIGSDIARLRNEPSAESAAAASADAVSGTGSQGETSVAA
ncbi:MAG: chemotaxis protein CheW [Sinobacteraceae bacterium]|nr:chemotaxis protein CheW [Nevskiaceae bacterium]